MQSCKHITIIAFWPDSIKTPEPTCKCENIKLRLITIQWVLLGIKATASAVNRWLWSSGIEDRINFWAKSQPVDQTEACVAPCAMSSPVGGPRERVGQERERRAAADWSCTLQCVFTLRAADARCYWDRHANGPELQEGPGIAPKNMPGPRCVSHLSPPRAAKSPGSALLYQHA